MNFAPKVTTIKGLSDRRRLPRLGSIRLGIKKQAKSGNTYPAETSYFVVPEEVAAVYGPEPTELEIMLPLNQIEAVFPQAYKFYGSGKGLKCQGDGEKAYKVDPETKELKQVECPCHLLEQGKCKQTATLMVMLPKVSVGGVYQIVTSSYHSIIDVNSGLDYVQALIGRFAMVPLKLRRVPTETHHDDKKQTHYTLQIVFDGDIQTLNLLQQDNRRVLESPRYQLPAPEEINPETLPPDVVDEEDTVEPEPPVIEGEVVDEDRTITKEEAAELNTALKETKATAQEFLAHMGVTRLGEIKQVDLETARTWINAKLDEAAA